MVRKLVVIGNGMVGQRLLEELVAQEHGYEITLFCAEPRPAYDRVQLSSYFAGASAEDLALTETAFFQRHGIRLLLGESAQHIDRVAKQVVGSKGTLAAYDALVLATGSYPFVPPIAGGEQLHAHVYRTLEDLDAIRESAQHSSSGVVIGGGLLGLEAAKALRDLGLATHVVEFAPRLMALQLDERAGAMLQREIERLGVHVHTGKATQSIGPGEDGRYRLQFADGSHLDADMLVYSAGIRPDDQLARAAGLEIGPRGGVCIGDDCRTSDAAIFAIGEVALWSGRVFGLVAPGYEMAKVCAAQLCALNYPELSSPALFQGADMSTKLKLLGVAVASIGDALGQTPGAQQLVFEDGPAVIYKKLVINAEGTRLLGAILVGDTDSYAGLLHLCLSDSPLPENPAALIAPGGDVGLDAGTLGAEAQICSCNNVSKGALCAAIQAGATDLAALKASTKAGSSCGGCAPVVKQVLDAQLRELGIAVSDHICEHFPYGRQALYDLVRVQGIRSFPALLSQYGQGRGCDICKPAVASILASCWNDFVLKPEHAALQDTNDAFLANLQKNGTYSVVPRIPGGEITPDKLLVIAQVAKKYDLYTKITGGQRIDLFGARLDELPLIWKELTAAGFESGHAYGKALRTVKSCVGSTWCRYGVQDSVAMAIRIEERYRGVRAPHKIKMAVSGCTRECAEAQSKDVGVIATEKGWNLYVCGNGGMRPRHAELFATDLDDEALLRTIDRFLMFYIKTADRLQRTSVWRDNLDGGLEYLQDVILADSLGIGATLEAQMQALVDSYACEWKRVLESPDALRRFKPFVNVDKPDTQVLYVRERGQKRPAKPDEMSTESTSVVEKLT